MHNGLRPGWGTLIYTCIQQLGPCGGHAIVLVRHDTTAALCRTTSDAVCQAWHICTFQVVLSTLPHKCVQTQTKMQARDATPTGYAAGSSSTSLGRAGRPRRLLPIWPWHAVLPCRATHWRIRMHASASTASWLLAHTCRGAALTRSAQGGGGLRGCSSDSAESSTPPSVVQQGGAGALSCHTTPRAGNHPALSSVATRLPNPAPVTAPCCNRSHLVPIFPLQAHCQL